VSYALLIEPPQYLPKLFGVADQLGVLFAHNVFTVDVNFDRLPLYVIALYPATITLAFDVVRAVGVFERRGALIGAVCVGFVYSCFYEVFDHLGPQLSWWAWNADDALNHPTMNAVPMTSVVILATLAPAALAFLVYVFVGGPVARGRRFGTLALSWRTVAVAALAPVALTALNLPTWLLKGHSTIAAVVFSAALVLCAAVAIPVLFAQWRRTRREGTQYRSGYVTIFGALYLATFAALWASALPEAAGAIDGVTSLGTPLGNFPYVAACFTFALACVASVSTVAPREPRRAVADHPVVQA
jgi:hypothetical protein